MEEEQEQQQKHRSASATAMPMEEQQELQQQHCSASATATSTTTTTLPMEEQQEVQQSRRRNASPTASQLVHNEEVMEDTYHSESIAASPSSHSCRSKSKPIQYYNERDMDEESEEEFFIGSDSNEVSEFLMRILLTTNVSMKY
jgi:hypothetical protein